MQFANYLPEFHQKMKLLFILLVFPLINGDKTVTTTNGPVRGISLAHNKVEAFLGIPYAEPPVGSLRFAKPVPKSSWENIYDANELPPSCVQLDLGNYYLTPDLVSDKMSENCLYLNLWVPEGGSDLKPILLFIHGGYFMTGSSNMKLYNGATLSEHGDVIVASINYRVGTLGFFYGLTEDAAGSMGMYDQIMAIQWIKDNAEYFGGDPDNIVLFGESAGGFSISMHIISPLSKNLFKRAILQSGTAFHPMFNDDKGLLMKSHIVANQLGCANESDSLQKNPMDVVDCMKTIPPEKFPEVDSYLFQIAGMMLPRIGDAFLPESAIDSYRNGDFKDTEILLGVNRDEGSLFLAIQLKDLVGLYGDKIENPEFNETFAGQSMLHFAKNEDEEIIRNIQIYLDRVKKESKYTYLNATIDFMGDLLITCGVVFQADFYSSKNNPVYFYVFDYPSASTPLAEWMGVTHGNELQFVFGNSVHQDFTEYEKEFSRDVMEMWVAFAKTGNPSNSGGVKWPCYTYQDPQYVVISEKYRVGVKPNNNRCESWSNFFRSVIDEDTLKRLQEMNNNPAGELCNIVPPIVPPHVTLYKSNRKIPLL